jgi:hypothetical protein
LAHMSKYTCILTSSIENQTREVGTEISLQQISHKGNVIPGCLEERINIACLDRDWGK